MKTRWDVRAKSRDDDVFRIHYTGVPFIRAVAAAIRYMREYDKILIVRNTVYGRKKR